VKIEKLAIIIKGMIKEAKGNCSEYEPHEDDDFWEGSVYALEEVLKEINK